MIFILINYDNKREDKYNIYTNNEVHVQNKISFLTKIVMG
jgi:hypothetical protein